MAIGLPLVVALAIIFFSWTRFTGVIATVVGSVVLGIIVFPELFVLAGAVGLYLSERRLRRALLKADFKLCPECHYPLTSERGTCPECGVQYSITDVQACWRASFPDKPSR